MCTIRRDYMTAAEYRFWPEHQRIKSSARVHLEKRSREDVTRACGKEIFVGPFPRTYEIGSFSGSTAAPLVAIAVK